MLAGCAGGRQVRAVDGLRIVVVLTETFQQREYRRASQLCNFISDEIKSIMGKVPAPCGAIQREYSRDVGVL